LIGVQLKPGRGAISVSSLAKGIIKVRFTAPAAGTVLIDWYGQPSGPSSKHASRHRPLIGSGRLSFKSAKTATISLRLTAAGRRLLRAAARVTVTSNCVFRPVGGAPVSVSATFALAR
jgi:hypothetical protein